MKSCRWENKGPVRERHKRDKSETRSNWFAPSKKRLRFQIYSAKLPSQPFFDQFQLLALSGFQSPFLLSTSCFFYNRKFVSLQCMAVSNLKHRLESTARVELTLDERYASFNNKKRNKESTSADDREPSPATLASLHSNIKGLTVSSSKRRTWCQIPCSDQIRKLNCHIRI